MKEAYYILIEEIGGEQMIEIKAGMVIGRKRVVRMLPKGPFMYARTQCLCKHKTVRIQSVASLVDGKSVSCSACFHDDLRAACDAVKIARHAEADAIRKQFGRKSA